MPVKYTIIIPHYNSPDRLRVLLESIPKTNDIQVIVIDDNSTKDSDLLGEIVSNDKRCEFYTNDTGVQSAGACRNIGLKNAKGKWILFSDADDFFFDGFTGHLEEYYDDPVDLVLFTPTSVDLSTGERTFRHVLYAGLVRRYLKHGNRKNENNLRYRFCVPWSKMIKRELVERYNIEFETVPVSNDIMFCTKVALYAKSFTATDKTIYCVTKDSGTLMTTPSEHNLDVRIDVLIRRCRLLREHMTERDMRKLDISGEFMLYRSLQWFGLKKLRETSKILKENKVKRLTLSLFNLRVALSVMRGKA